jgi:MFS transporter, UMF1 family
MNQNLSEKLKIFGWTLFDFGNTAFSVMIVTFAYPLYYKLVLAENNSNSDFYWGLTVSISMFICAIISPILGAAADFSKNRKKILFIFTFTSILSTALLYFTYPGMIVIGSILFVLANIGFEGGIVFYDSFLPNLTASKNYGRVSGYGFAMGYLGAFAILLISLPFLNQGVVYSNLENFRFTFLITALFFLIFAIPLFFVVKEEKIKNREHYSYLKVGYERIKITIKNLKKYNNVLRFLIAFFIYNDGILTVIAFASIVAAKTFNFSIEELILFFLSVQSAAIIGSILFGIVTDKIGAKKTITITLILWVFTIIFSFVADSKSSFYIVGFLAGSLLGSSQASSRCFMARLTPKLHEAEFFGFYDGLCGKASAIVGPLLFGIISSITNSQRLAILSVVLFFIIGLILLQRVNEEKENLENENLNVEKPV